MSVLITPSPLLRNALFLDAVASGAMALLLLGAAPWLAGLFGMAQPLLLGAGAVCLFWALFVGAMSQRERLSIGVVWAIIALNVLWVVESIALSLLGWVEPATLGMAFVVVQALAVAVFAELQFLGLASIRRAAAASA